MPISVGGRKENRNNKVYEICRHCMTAVCFRKVTVTDRRLVSVNHIKALYINACDYVNM